MKERKDHKKEKKKDHKIENESQKTKD